MQDGFLPTCYGVVCDFFDIERVKVGADDKRGFSVVHWYFGSAQQVIFSLYVFFFLICFIPYKISTPVRLFFFPFSVLAQHKACTISLSLCNPLQNFS